MASAVSTGVTEGSQLGRIASRLTDIAGTVAAEAEAATAAVRGMTVQAHEIAELAAALQVAANMVESNVAQQVLALDEARQSLAEHEPTIKALADSVASVSAISAVIGRISHQSQLLALNARIEASRSGDDGRGFAAVATEMSTLATQTQTTTDDIAARAGIIARDVAAAHHLVAAQHGLVTTQDHMLTVARDNAEQQRRTAAALAAITSETALAVDAAATTIGRVGASAVAVKMLARQIARIAGEG